MSSQDLSCHTALWDWDDKSSPCSALVTRPPWGRALLAHRLLLLRVPQLAETGSVAGSCPAEPPPVQDWATAPTKARGLLLQVGHLPLPASRLSERQAELCIATGTEDGHSSPGETVSPQPAQGCRRRGHDKPCPELFPPQKQTGRLNHRMGQPKVQVKHTHGNGEVPWCTFSTNSLKQNKYMERAIEDGGDSMTKKNK